jgi:Bacterial membrane protein YfhO
LFLAAGLLAGASAPGLLDVLYRLPLFSMALNYRLAFLAPLGLAGLAALGVDSVRERSVRQAGLLAAGWAAVLLAAFFLSRGIFEERQLPRSFVVLAFAMEVGPLLVFAALSVLPGVGSRRAAAGALILFVAQRGLEMAGTYPTLPASTLAPPLEALEDLSRHGPGRVAAGGDVFRPNASALYRVEDVRGYESIVLDRLADTFPLWCVPQQASFNRVDELSSPFLTLLNTRYAIAPPGSRAPSGWRSLRRTETMEIFENPAALPRAFVPRTLRYEMDSRKTLTEMRSNTDFGKAAWMEEPSAVFSEENGEARLELRTAGPDLILAADASRRVFVATSVPAWPGWRAEKEGRELPIVVVNHAFIGFWLPPGRGLIRLRYCPRSFPASLGALAMGLALAAASSVRRMRSPEGWRG